MKARYDTAAMGLHWVIAISMIPILLFGEDLMKKDGGTFLPSVHVSLGTGILALSVLIGLPLTGWLAFGNFLMRHPGMAEVSIFGLTQVPYAPDSGKLAGNIHAIGSKIGIALVVLHVLASLKHQCYTRDGLMRRMLPF